MKKKELLIILIPTFICVLAWIGFSIYHASESSTISQEEMIQIIPIDPNFNTKIISELKTREKVEPVYQTTSNPQSPTPSPTITTINDASSKNTQATTGGKLKR